MGGGRRGNKVGDSGEGPTNLSAPDDSSANLKERREHFMNHLRQFMESRGTPLAAKMPMMNGRTIDLYTLYEEVKRAGGYNVLLQKKMWKVIALQVFNVPATCMNAGYSLRMLYKRTLLPYELKYHVASADLQSTPAASVLSMSTNGDSTATASSSSSTSESLGSFCSISDSVSTKSIVQTLGATKIIAPSIPSSSSSSSGSSSAQQGINAEKNGSSSSSTSSSAKARLTTFQRTAIPTQQNTRMTYRHYFEVSALRIHAALQSGIELQVAWALRTLLVKSFNGEFALEHAPGVLLLLLDRVAHFVSCEDDDGKPEEKRQKTDDIEEELDDLFASGSPRATVLVILMNLSHLAQNARDMAASPLFVEYMYHGLCCNGGGSAGRGVKIAGGTEGWRLHLDMLCGVAPWIELDNTLATLPDCVHNGLLKLLVGRSFLFSDDDATVCATVRALAQLAGVPRNEHAFKTLLENGTDEQDRPLMSTVPLRVAHLFVMGNAVQQQSLLTLLDRLCRLSSTFAATAAQEPLIFRRLISVVIEVAGMSPTVEELAVFQDVVERGKAAATVLRNMLLSCTTSEFQCVFAYESFFACLAASDSPLAQHASTIIAALVTVSESLS